MSENAPAPFETLRRNHYGVIYTDPPWNYADWGEGTTRTVSSKYKVMPTDDIGRLPVAELAAPDCALFMWVAWPKLKDAWELLDYWGFTYKTCAFSWVKANTSQIDLFRDDADAQVGMGNWTRANSEVCLLATRGRPSRLNADVRQGIIEPRREHSRKPDCVYARIERLVAGPYVELFARTTHAGWSSWGNQVDKFAEASA